MKKKPFDKLSSRFTVIPTDCNGFETIRMGWMKFRAEHNLIAGVGSETIVWGSKLFGKTKTQMVIVTPIEKDAPILIFERTNRGGREALYFDLVDTVISDSEALAAFRKQMTYYRDGLRTLDDIPANPNWSLGNLYDESIRKTESKAILNMKTVPIFSDCMDFYCDLLEHAPAVNPFEKADRTRRFLDAVLNGGKHSGNWFVKKLGKEKAQKLFYNILFGIR